MKKTKKIISFALFAALMLALFCGTANAADDELYYAVIDRYGDLWVWGWNAYGQLGDGTVTYKSSPVKVMEDAAYVSMGFAHTMAIDNDKNLWAWGMNGGRLGNGSTENRSFPVKIMEGAVQVSANTSHTLAIKSDGSLWAWGRNAYGQLGDNTKVDKLQPVKIMDDIAQVSAGGSHSMAIDNNGNL
ncbi:MAG: hypothetical protein FWH48_02765, partial [Oscillospiraceae bacterium]|nr:hypothetical protein [Oscillospiraceae bacterium]